MEETEQDLKEVARIQSRVASLKYYHNNKEKCAAKAKLWRQSNKEYVIRKQKEDKRKRKELAIQYLGGKCKTCEQIFHPACYEFHHRNPAEKDRDPSKMLQLSWKRLTAELDKCDLLCANCHRLEHNKDNYKWDHLETALVKDASFKNMQDSPDKLGNKKQGK